MKTLEIHIPEDLTEKVEQAAAHQGVSLAEFVRASIEEKLARGHEFRRASQYVLAKNADLYERLP